MEEKLNKVSELIDKTNNLPSEIKNIVKAICKAYIRESSGKIPIEGIINVCNTTFIKIDENDKSFSGKEKILGNTQTDYDNNCNVIHKMSYVDDSNYVKLITILTHELGHVITESKPCAIDENGVYPWAKRTATFYKNCLYKENVLQTEGWCGYRVSDGFLESICTKIFESPEFKQELYVFGYDLKDYTYKDERLFPSRIYDEYKACFELFDYIMDGALFDFACMSFKTNNVLLEYIEKHKIHIIFKYLDNSNDALWALKSYEGKEWTESFNDLFKEYLEHKKTSLTLAEECLELYGKSKDDVLFQQLYNNYKSTLSVQKLLPISKEYLTDENKKSL